MTTPDTPEPEDLTGLDVEQLDGLAEFEYDGDPDVEFVDAPLEDDQPEHGANTDDEMIEADG